MTKMKPKNSKTAQKKNIHKKHIGSGKVQKKVANAWTEEDMIEALHTLDSIPGASIRGTAKKYGINEATLRFRARKRASGVSLGKAGRKLVFNEETEASLAKCIAVVCNLGFSPTMFEIIVSITFFNSIDFSGAI